MHILQARLMAKVESPGMETEGWGGWVERLLQEDRGKRQGRDIRTRSSSKGATV